MVCNRCIKVVREEFEKLGLNIKNIILGEVVIDIPDERIDMTKIKSVLEENGFELLDDRQTKLIEKIKILIIELIHHNKERDLSGINFSEYLSNNINLSYQYLSTLFSSTEGITIEKFIINQKIEKVKEMLIYDELTLSEISYQLGYSSVQHLSSQFKKITGLSPTEFKHLKNKSRIPIDKLNR
jgi:AraC-like DNA-binding protein